jgi:hypothetical protein
MGVGIAKVHEQSIPEQLGDMPIKTCDHLGADFLVCPDNLPILFRVELGREAGGIDQVTEHDRELSAFSVRKRSSKGRFNLSGWLCLHNGLWCSLSKLRGDCLGSGRFPRPHEHLTILLSGELVDFDEFILQDV